MSTSERPGVYTTYEVSSGASAYGSGGAVGLAAGAANTQDGKVVAVTSYAEAVSVFGEGNLTKLVQVLLANGAPVIYAAAVSDEDYKTAFDALMKERAVKFMVCDSHSSEVHDELKTAILGGEEACKYRIAFVESDASERPALIEAAGKLDCERMVLVSHHVSGGTPGAVAAAVCAAAAAESDPALPLSGAVLQGLGELGDNFSDAELTLLVQGGVTPLETVAGEISVIRGVTTRTKSGEDATWRDLTTVRIVDTLLPQIRDSLRARFSRSKNNAQTRGAIRTQVVIELEDALSKEYIDSYGDVSVAASEGDGSVCTVSFDFAVTHGLNRIELKASITV